MMAPALRRTLAGSLLALASALPAAAQMALPEAVGYATALDPNVTALRQQIASRTVGIQAAKDAYYPSLSVSADTDTTDSSGPGLTLTLTQVLYDWGAIRSDIKAATQARVQAVADLKSSVEELTLLVAQSYLDAEIAQSKIALTEQYMDYAGRLAGQAEDRARAGLGDNGEVARARLEIARARDRMANLQADQQMSLSQLQFLTGRPVTGIVPAPDIAYAAVYGSYDKILSAVRIAPDYVAGRARMVEAEAGVEAAKAARLPTISLQAQGRTDLNGGRTRTAIGVSAGVDLNASKIGGRAVQVAQMDYEASRSSLQAVERQLLNTAQTASQQITILRATEASRVAQLTQAQRVLDNYEDQFIAGRRDLIDVLTTGRDLYDAQIDQVETHDERKRTEYEAAADLGVLGTLLLTTLGEQ